MSVNFTSPPVLARIFATTLATCSAALLGLAPANAQDAYPSKPIQLISSQGVGGGVDTLLRAISITMSAKGVNVVVDARPGANGQLAVNACKTARPDGYTYCLVNTQFVMLPHLQTKPAYDELKDFDPVTHLITSPAVLAVTSQVPVKTFKELVAYSAARPSELNYVSHGPANPGDVGIEEVMRQVGVSWTPIPYKGAADAGLAFAKHEVQISFSTAVNIATMISGDRGKALLVTSDKRLPTMPGVPTLSELGLSSTVSGIWMGVIAPKGTPKAMREKFAALLAETLKAESVRQRALDSGYELVGNTPDQFGRFIATETAVAAKALAGKPKQ